MNLRACEPGDLPALVATYTASIHGLASPHYSPAQIEAWAPRLPDLGRWRTRLEALRTWVLDSDGALVGFAAHTSAGYLDFLFTHPDHARRGVATRLCRHVETVLAGLGVSTVTTHASLAARAFFDRQGFRLDAEESVECRGVVLRRFAMHKPLAGGPDRVRRPARGGGDGSLHLVAPEHGVMADQQPAV